jgi:hypothetical protein
MTSIICVPLHLAVGQKLLVVFCIVKAGIFLVIVLIFERCSCGGLTQIFAIMTLFGHVLIIPVL